MVNKPYTIMPFAFERREDNSYFLSGMGGDFVFLSEREFHDFVEDRLDDHSESYAELEAKKLLTTGEKAAKLLTANGLLTRKAFTFSGPRLHIVVVTRGCNCHCDYCHASSYSPGMKAPQMSLQVAARTAQTIMSSPSREITVEFQGGEPALAWEIVQFMVEYIRLLNSRAHKLISFVFCTNLLFLDDAMIKYIVKRHIEVSTSLDGPPELHDLHRHMPDASAHAVFMGNLKKLESKTGIKASPLLTVTRDNLWQLRKVIDHYIECGRNGIFIRPLNPFGRATQDNDLGYSTEEFIEAYLDAAEYILQLNQQGIEFREFLITLFLRRIYTPFDDGFVDLKFPAGAGLAVLVYNIDGNVYPSDEARMMAASGDTSLCMGNVLTMSGESIRQSPIAKKIFASSVPSLVPGCTSCPYAPYCGVDPVRAYARTGDFMLYSESDECRKNRAILRWLFEKIRTADEQLSKILYGWTV